MKKALLLKVKEAILAEPKNYDQNNLCGTACCIAGHAVAIAKPKTWSRLNKEDDGALMADTAKSLLGLDNEQYYRICNYAHSWPEPFDTKFGCATTSKQRAKIAAKRIDHFIATGGAE